MPDDKPADDESGSTLDPAIRQLIRALAHMQADADDAAAREAAMLKEVARFKCVDASGREYTVIERRHVITSREMAGVGTGLGTLSYVTASGEPVNALDDGTFELPLKELILRKV